MAHCATPSRIYSAQLEDELPSSLPTLDSTSGSLSETVQTCEHTTAMDRDPSSSSSRAFNSLPIELNKTIAHYLDTDRDIASFRLICRGTNDAIDADKGSFWRVVFRRKFAIKDGSTNIELKKYYQRRAKYLRLGTTYNFFRGHRAREGAVMKVLRDLIVESFVEDTALDEHNRPRCKNLAVLADFVLNSKLLLNERRAPPPERREPSHVHPLLASIKLMCSHFLFEHEEVKQNIFALEQSQHVVYKPTNAAPIYQGPDLTEVNMDWVLHCLNFFRHHMNDEQTMSLVDTMRNLSPGEKPSAWQGKLRQGAYPLGKYWKGTYAYLELGEIRKVRKMSEEDMAGEIFIDKNVDEGKIQSLQLDFAAEGSPTPWPKKFEDRLHALRDTVTSCPKAQGRSKTKDVAEVDTTRSIHFVGSGVDLEDDFNALGWLNALPDQQGIPGWQRVTFMKHFMDDFDQVEEDNLWAYEGVALPGGRIILGRWWYASEEVSFDRDYNGPFILWATDEPEIEDRDEPGDDSK